MDTDDKSGWLNAVIGSRRKQRSYSTPRSRRRNTSKARSQPIDSISSIDVIHDDKPRLRTRKIKTPPKPPKSPKPPLHQNETSLVSNLPTIPDGPDNDVPNDEAKSRPLIRRVSSEPLPQENKRKLVLHHEDIVKLKDENNILNVNVVKLDEHLNALKGEKRTVELLLQKEKNRVSELEDQLLEEITMSSRVSELEDQLIEEKASRLEDTQEMHKLEDRLIEEKTSKLENADRLQSSENRVELLKKENQSIIDKLSKQSKILESNTQETKIPSVANYKNSSELQAEIFQSNEEVIFLEKSMAEMKSMHERAKEKNEILIIDLRSQIIKDSRTISLLKSEIDTNVIAKDAEIVKLKDDLDRRSIIISTINESCDSKVEELSKNHAEVKAKLEVVLQREQALSLEKQQQVLVIESLQKEISALKLDQFQIRSKHTKLTGELEESLQKINVVLETHRTFVKMSNDRILTLKDRVNELESKKDEEDAANSRHQAEPDKNPHSNNYLNGKISTLTAEHTLMSSEYTNQLRNAEQARLSYVGQINKLVARIEQLKIENKGSTTNFVCNKSESNEIYNSGLKMHVHQGDNLSSQLHKSNEGSLLPTIEVQNKRTVNFAPGQIEPESSKDCKSFLTMRDRKKSHGTTALSQDSELESVGKYNNQAQLQDDIRMSNENVSPQDSVIESKNSSNNIVELQRGKLYTFVYERTGVENHRQHSRSDPPIHKHQGVKSECEVTKTNATKPLPQGGVIEAGNSDDLTQLHGNITILEEINRHVTAE